MTAAFKRVAFALSGFVLLAFIGWRVLSLGMADHFATSDPERALWWRTLHPVALVAAAEREVASNPARAEVRARAALREDFRQGMAYRVLGDIAEAKGQHDRAMALYETASRTSPRDIPTHARLRAAYLAKGQAAPALRHMDLILRVEPQLATHEFPILVQLAALPWAQAALGDVLLRRPPWREGFVEFLSRKAPDGSAVAPLVARLRAADAGLSTRELSAWLERLIKDHRWGEAYLTWATSLSPAERAQLGNVHDGGFELDPSDTGFGWRVGKIAGAYVELQAADGAEGKRALHVGFEDQRVPFRHVRQLLALPAGAYRLRGRSKAESLRSERGLVWTLRCAEGGAALAETEALRGTTPWRKFELDFVVPASECGAQWLELNVPARIAAERQISGQAWFDKISVVSRNDIAASQ